MRRFSVALIAAVSTTALTQIASAADLPVKAPVYKAPIIAPYSWTGFYVGGNIGYSWGNADSTAEVPSLAAFGLPTTFTDSLKPKGIIGGGQIGYNWQASPNWVLGIEADLQASGQRDSASRSDPFLLFFPNTEGPPSIVPGTATFSHEEKLQWFGTVRGRIGYAFWNDVMLYGTGGLAYGHVSSSVTETVTIGGISTAASFSDSKTKVGWTLGAGIEGALPNTRNWTWKVEYLYIDLGTVDYAFSDPTLGAVMISNKVTDNIVRVGINYRLN
jgi:outer membrane immunogenic protein